MTDTISEQQATCELGRTAADKSLPLFLQWNPDQAAALDKTLDLLLMEVKHESDLLEKWRDFPHLNWRSFLLLKLNETKRTRDKDFTTIRTLQNLLAKA